MIRRALPFGMYEFDTFANFPNSGKHGYIYRAKINNQLFLCDEGTYRPLTGGIDSVYRGIFPSLAALQSAYPTDTTGSFAIADGDLYVYDGGWKTVSEQFNPYLGDYASLAALQTAHPAPISGSIATITGELYIFTTSWVLASQPTVLYRGEYATLTDLQIAHPTDVTGAYANVAGVLYVFDVSWKPVSEPQAFYRGEYANLADLQQAYPTDVDGAYATVAGVMYMYVSGHDWVIVSEPAVPYRGEFVDLDALLAAHSTDVEGATALVQGALYIYTSGVWTEIVDPNTPYRGDYVDYAALETAYPNDVDGAYATVAGNLYIYGNGQWNVVSEAEAIYRGQYISLYMLQQAYPTDVTGAYATVGSTLYIYDNGWKMVSESEVIYRGEFADLLALQTAYPTDVTGAYATIAGVLYIYDNGWKAVSEPEVIFRGDFATLVLLEAAYPTDIDGAYATVAGTLYIFNSGSWNVVSESTYRGVFPTVAALKAKHPTDVMGALAVVVNVLYVYITDWVEASKSDTAIWPNGGNVRDMIRLVDPDTDEVKWEAFPFTDEEILIIKDRLALKPGMPVNYDPVDGAVDIYQVPEFTGSPYNDHANKAPMEAMEIQIAADSGFLNLIYQKIFYQSTTMCSPNDFWALITPSTTYYWRIRYSDTYGVWSYWSDATSFTTMAVFEPTIIKQPKIIIPYDGVKSARVNPLIISNTFEVIGLADTHQSTDWEIGIDPTFSNLIAQSQNDTTNLTIYQPELALASDAYARCRYKGTLTAAKSPYSTHRLLRPRDVYTDPLIGVMATRVKGSDKDALLINHIDEQSNLVNLSPAYFKTHPLFNLISKEYASIDADYGKRQMVYIPPFYIKCESNLDADIGESVHKFWISPSEFDGSVLHPAFIPNGGGGLYIGAGGFYSYLNSTTLRYVVHSDIDYEETSTVASNGVRGYNSAVVINDIDNVLNTGINSDFTGWHLMTYYEAVILNLLMLIEYRLFDGMPGVKVLNNYSKTVWKDHPNYKGIYGMYDAIATNVCCIYTQGIRYTASNATNRAASYKLANPANVNGGVFDISANLPSYIAGMTYGHSNIGAIDYGFDNVLNTFKEVLFIPTFSDIGTALGIPRFQYLNNTTYTSTVTNTESLNCSGNSGSTPILAGCVATSYPAIFRLAKYE